MVALCPIGSGIAVLKLGMAGLSVPLKTEVLHAKTWWVFGCQWKQGTLLCHQGDVNPRAILIPWPQHMSCGGQVPCAPNGMRATYFSTDSSSTCNAKGSLQAPMGPISPRQQSSPSPPTSTAHTFPNKEAVCHTQGLKPPHRAPFLTQTSAYKQDCCPLTGPSNTARCTTRIPFSDSHRVPTPNTQPLCSLHRSQSPFPSDVHKGSVPSHR